jgi:hypothetical protein
MKNTVKSTAKSANKQSSIGFLSFKVPPIFRSSDIYLAQILRKMSQNFKFSYRMVS